MCTLSWKILDSGYTLFFNRDEQRSRPAALPPSLRQHNGVHFLSPTDPQHQGTWLLVNEFALTICLLNHYPTRTTQPDQTSPSRGLLPLLCADCADVGTAVRRLLAIPPMPYMPFQFVAISPTQAAQAIWDGHTITTSTLPRAGGMLTSSSIQPEAITQLRHATFQARVGRIGDASIDILKDFHYQPGMDDSSGIRMSRPDACTHSISTITVSNRSRLAKFHYMPLVSRSPEDLPSEFELPLSSRQEPV